MSIATSQGTNLISGALNSRRKAQERTLRFHFVGTLAKGGREPAGAVCHMDRPRRHLKQFLRQERRQVLCHLGGRKTSVERGTKTTSPKQTGPYLLSKFRSQFRWSQGLLCVCFSVGWIRAHTRRAANADTDAEPCARRHRHTRNSRGTCTHAHTRVHN